MPYFPPALVIPVTVSNGGTGVSTLTGIPKFAGTAAITAATAGTDYSVPSGVETFSGAKTINSGNLILAGATSGTTTLNATATASGTLTLPAATDTLVGKATTDTLTNKTINASQLVNATVTPDKLATGAANALTTGSSTTTSTSYALLADAVSTADTVTIGANGLALVTISSFLANNSAGGESYVSFVISGATSVASSDTNCIMLQVFSANAEGYLSGAFLVTGLTAGSTTFTLQFKVNRGNTGTFKNRRIAVVPL